MFKGRIALHSPSHDPIVMGGGDQVRPGHECHKLGRNRKEEGPKPCQHARGGRKRRKNTQGTQAACAVGAGQAHAHARGQHASGYAWSEAVCVGGGGKGRGRTVCELSELKGRLKVKASLQPVHPRIIQFKHLQARRRFTES